MTKVNGSWVCARCYDVPYGKVLDRRDGNCDKHGEVTEVRLSVVPPRREALVLPVEEAMILGAEEVAE